MDLDSKITLSHLCEDVLLVICSFFDAIDERREELPMKNLSLVNHRLRDVLVPHLFKTLRITRPLSQLIATPLPALYATTCIIDMFGSKWWWCSGAYVSSRDALAIFHLLHTLTHVSTLQVTMMRRSIDMFTTAYSSTPTTDRWIFVLGGIKTLIVSSPAGFLASQCPNLTHLHIEDKNECSLETYTDLPTRLQALLPDVGAPQGLESLEATGYWSVDEVDRLASLFPSLKRLDMRSETYCYRASLDAIVALLAAKMPRLKSLGLVKIDGLDAAYHATWRRCPRSRACSSALYRKMVWRQQEERRIEAENRVVGLVFGSLAGLRECWVGEARVARRLEGESVWTWERRLDEEEQGESEGIQSHSGPWFGGEYF